MPIISLREVSFKYPGEKLQALVNVSFDIEEGEFLLVLGGDRSGKSTLCRTLNGLIPHETKGEFSGKVILRNTSISSMHVSDVSRRVGLMLQDPEMQLFTDSVEEEVAFGPENLGIAPDEIEQRVAKALDMTGLSSLRNKSPSGLSGGQKQRLAIASILSMMPEVLVLDEPLSMLDPKGRAEFLIMLDILRKQTQMTVVVTSQEAEEVLPHADRVAILDRGVLRAIGPPSKVIASSERLTAIGIEPPQLLALSESLRNERLIAPDRSFFTEDDAASALSRLSRTRRG